LIKSLSSVKILQKLLDNYTLYHHTVCYLLAIVRNAVNMVGNRRIYDPRRWHKRSSSNNAHMSGQPPAGWVLVWAGRFKRWRRRWFVAHPPGLLLHYKSSDQIGQPGCISLVVSILLLLFSIKLVVSVWVLDSWWMTSAWTGSNNFACTKQGAAT
jgi:hypothetical protein